MIKFTSLKATLAASALGVTLFGGVSQAQASSLVSIVPQTEGEIIFGNPITGAGNSYTIQSLDYDGPGGRPESRLFIDNRTTENTYAGGQIKFQKTDAGTNPDGFWFRPVAENEDGTYPENGQLEVGKFKFTFAKELAQLKLRFFDVEDVGTVINNIISSGLNPASIAVAPGPNSNIQTVTLFNVSSFDVQLGRIGGRFNPGDGVRMQLFAQPVPEPATILGLGAFGVAGAFGLRKAKKSSQAI